MSKSIPQVTVSLTAEEIFVRLNEITHLRLLQSDFAGLQSWKVTHGAVDEPLFKIEIYRRSGGHPVLLEYDDRELWTAMLAELDRIFVACGGTVALRL